MKNFTLTFAAVCAAALAVVSCKTKDPDRPEFTVIERAETFRDGDRSYELDYRFEYLSWYSDDHVARTVEAGMISDFFGVEFLKVNPMESSTAFDETAEHNFETHSDGEFSWNGYLKMRSFADVLNDRLVGYTVERSDYTGGAHGMETTQYTTYDLRTGARLTLDDVFTPEGIEALAGAIRTEIMKGYHAEAWDELYDKHCFYEVNSILPNDNFRLDARHITFVYNPYDIACYAQGSTRVKLPLANLTGFRKEILEK